jgi:predicted amidophosphoribosyltransferase
MSVRNSLAAAFTAALRILFPPRATEVVVRGLSVDELWELLKPFRLPGVAIPIYGLLPYRKGPVHACIVEAKFHGNAVAQELLGGVLARYLLDSLAWLDGTTSTIALISIPLSKARRRERGYNQAERIASYAASQLGGRAILRPELLERVRNTPPQTSLGGIERRKNLIGAFHAPIPLDLSICYLLLDDVATTGATFLAATEALRASGAQHIQAISLAY